MASLNDRAELPASNSTLPLQSAAGAAILIALCTVIYLPAMRGAFMLDDDVLLTQNRMVKAPDGLARIWFSTEATDYWPVFNSSLWLEWRLWKLNPIGYHVTNLVLHILGSLLLWTVLKELAIPGAFFAALLFAVHPVNVDSVAWIAQRKNVLAMVFFLLAILWYLKADGKSDLPANKKQSGVTSWYWLSLFAFLLAMLSKGSVAILPLVLLLIARWQRGRITKADLLRTAPFFLIAIALTAVNVWFRTHGAEITIRNATFMERLLGAGAVVWFYLWKAVWPVNLVFVYPQWEINAADLRWWLPLVAAVAVTALLWRVRRSPWGRGVFFAWLYFCVCLLPVMGFTDVGYMVYSLVADHYQHLAIIAVVALAAAGWACWRRESHRFGKIVATTAAVAVIAIFSLLSWRQAELYGNPRALYETTLRANPNCWLALNNLGQIEAESGHRDVAMENFRRVLELNPNNTQAHYNLAIQLAAQDKPADALAQYQEALRLGMETADLYNNLGMQEAELGRSDDAIAHYQRALVLDPESSQTHYNLGIELATRGNLPEAIKQYQEAVRLGPLTADLRNNYGIAQAMSGQLDQAVQNFELAHRTEPENLQAMVNLASGYARLGRWADAIAMARQAQSHAGNEALSQQLAEQIRQYEQHQSQAAGSTAAPDKSARP